jgi:hypothetical protein
VTTHSSRKRNNKKRAQRTQNPKEDKPTQKIPKENTVKR